MTRRLDADLDDALARVAHGVGIDANLLRAFSLVETGGDRWAVRFEPAFTYLVTPEKFATALGITVATETMLQKTSWGPMQIMGAVAREAGFMDHLTKLTDANLAYLWSCAQLKRIFSRFPLEQDSIAAWNAGSPRRTNAHTYSNQSYVDKVSAELATLRKTIA